MRIVRAQRHFGRVIEREWVTASLVAAHFGRGGGGCQHGRDLHDRTSPTKSSIIHADFVTRSRRRHGGSDRCQPLPCDPQAGVRSPSRQPLDNGAVQQQYPPRVPSHRIVCWLCSPILIVLAGKSPSPSVAPVAPTPRPTGAHSPQTIRPAALQSSTRPTTPPSANSS